jgi:hypothetical protein
VTHPTGNLQLDVPLAYIETTIPTGMTIDAYRRSRPPRPRLTARVRCALTGRTA